MKHYFDPADDEKCYPLRVHIDNMKEEGIATKTVVLAKRVVGGDNFFCREHDAVGAKDEPSCGMFCPHYQPRNGRSGICTHNGPVYEPTEITKTITINLQ